MAISNQFAVTNTANIGVTVTFGKEKMVMPLESINYKSVATCFKLHGKDLSLYVESEDVLISVDNAQCGIIDNGDTVSIVVKSLRNSDLKEIVNGDENKENGTNETFDERKYKQYDQPSFVARLCQKAYPSCLVQFGNVARCPKLNKRNDKERKTLFKVQAIVETMRHSDYHSRRNEYQERRQKEYEERRENEYEERQKEYEERRRKEYEERQIEYEERQNEYEEKRQQEYEEMREYEHEETENE